MEDLEIGFICKNTAQVYAEGKLKLAVPFVIEYGSSIKEKVYFEMPSGEIWCGKYFSGSDYVCGLENMMSFYGVRPYHIVVLTYCGDEHFKLKIFNECGVEICYPFSCPSSSNFRFRRNDPFVSVGKMNLDDIEIDKLTSTFSFNVLHHFVGLHDIVICKDHLTPQQKYEVMSSSAFKKLGMDKGVNKMEFCFEHYSWMISLSWKKGCLFFDKGWYEFVKESKIVEGDICVVQRTCARGKFKIVVLPKLLLTQWSLTSDTNTVDQRFSWLKRMKGSCLDTGIIEIPRLFARRLGGELGREINLLTSDGRAFSAKYSFSKNKLYGLMDIINAYDIYRNCIIVFEYVGNSTFNVCIFDSLNMDHLKEVTGEFISDILRQIEMEETEVPNQTENEIEVGRHVNIRVENNAEETVVANHEPTVPGNKVMYGMVQCNVGIEMDDITVSAGDLVMFTGNDVEDFHEGNDEVIVLGNDCGNDFGGGSNEIEYEVEVNNSFLITLKKSHVDKKCHGAYCSTVCYELYKDWVGGTSVILNYKGEDYEVQVQRNNRSCRFGKGWDDFIKFGKLREGEKLESRFSNADHINVSKIN